MATTMEAQSVKSTGSATAPSQSWWQDISKNRALAGGIVLGAIALGVWFAVVSGQRKEDFANRALEQARNVAETGNFPLAASELQKVISTYAGTEAAQEALVTLNQVRMENGQQELAVVGLQDFVKGNPKAKFVGQAYALLGRALEDLGRGAEAAKAYGSASDEAEGDFLKAEYLLDAARSYAFGGDRDQAIATYRRLIKEYPKTSSKVEAEVRLAELTRGAM
jgi:outer membrane protein assembly factor BamD (BamD/ComL family)